MSAGVGQHHGLPTPVDQGLAAPLVDDGVEAAEEVQRRRRDHGVVQPLQVRRRRVEAGVDYAELEGAVAVRGAEVLEPGGGGGRGVVRVLEGGSHEGGHAPALAEAHHAVHAACVADRGGDAAHAVFEAAVEAAGVVFAEPLGDMVSKAGRMEEDRWRGR